MEAVIKYGGLGIILTLLFRGSNFLHWSDGCIKLQAYAAVKFADACLRGLRGEAGVVAYAFLESQACSASQTCYLDVHVYESATLFIIFERSQVSTKHGLSLSGDWTTVLCDKSKAWSKWSWRDLPTRPSKRIWKVLQLNCNSFFSLPLSTRSASCMKFFFCSYPPE